jgi:beta-phosphoglucomutase-like phosphatase (HAD superfamily)
VAAQLNHPPAGCVVIEDSATGIEAGLAAGMQVIGYSADPDHKASDKVPFVHSLVELIDVLG